MGTENPNRANTYQRPTGNPFAPPQSNMSISSSRPVVGSEASAFRPTSVPASMSTVPATSNITPFSSPGPVVGYGTLGFRPMQPGRPAPSFGLPTTGPIPRCPTPQFPSTSQAPLPQTSNVGQPMLPPSMGPTPPGHIPPMSTSLNRQPQIPPPPMGSPPQSLYSASSNSYPPKSFVDSPFSASRPNMQQPPLSTGPPYQSTLPGYQGMQSSSVSPPPPPPPPVSYQGGYVPSQPTISAPFSSHQGAYGQAPPVASTPGMYLGGSAPPMGGMSGLAEDFSSLSLGSVPGSHDAGVDAKVLPRPLDGDAKATQQKKHMDADIDHYVFLGLPSGEEGSKLSEKEITRAYKSKALQLHPDKRPDDPNAPANFQKLQTSYEILKDEKARKLFDDLLRAKRQKVQRQSQQDSKRRRMMSDLEERERAAYAYESSGAAKSEEEIIARKLKEEISRIRAMQANKMSFGATGMSPSKKESARGERSSAGGGGLSAAGKEKMLKVSWEKGGLNYTAQRLREIFERFGEVKDVIIRSSKKKESALIVMGTKEAVVTATGTVCGDLSNPLLVVPLQPDGATSFPTAREPVKPDGPQLNEDLFGARYQAFEDSVLQKLRKAAERQK